MSDVEDPLGAAAVPSLGTLFDAPEDSPPVVSPRLAQSDRGRLYRSAYAEGPRAEMAIAALTKAPPVDPSLPQSPEVLAAEQAAAAIALADAEAKARAAAAASEAARAAEAEALAAAAAAAALTAPPVIEPDVVAEIPAADAAVEGISDNSPSETAESVSESGSESVTESATEAPATDAPATDAEVAAALGLLPPPVTATPVAPVVPVAPLTPPIVAPAATPLPPLTPMIPVVAAVDDVVEPIAAVPPPAVVLPSARRGPEITWTQATLLIVGVTFLFALADVVLRHSIGALTGIGLLLSTVAAALLLRRDDIWAAVIMPPLAFLVALLTAGQLTVGSSGSVVSRQALNIVTGLSINAPWILGATAVGLVIVLLRRRRFTATDSAVVPESVVDDAESLA